MSRVLVVGGRGFMGRRVIRLLKQTLPDVEVLSGGRGSANDRVVDVRAPLPDALEGVDVLINCVGPFDYDPRSLIEACVAGGVHYLDLAETAGWIAQASVSVGDTAIVPGCSSVPGLIQVFAQRWKDRPEIAKIRAQLSIGTNNPGSGTLLYSMLEPVGRRGWFRRSWLREHGDLPARRYANYPAGVDHVDLGGRSVPLEFGFGFDRRLYTSWLRLTAPLVGLTPRPLLKLQAWWMRLCSPLMRPFGSRIGILSLDALGADGLVFDSIEIRAAENGLDVPAWPSVWATEAILSDGGRGARTLADLVSAQTAEEKLLTAGYQVRPASAQE
ncbi:MAG: saccharopine dehydrogenase NADP-binding domain-containing protein [Planctomycetes bacterium]|nr:saccharopine dehydrogenase NADP-binding domain-containing protein [Planctomycetota bacterium]